MSEELETIKKKASVLEDIELSELQDFIEDLIDNRVMEALGGKK